MIYKNVEYEYFVELLRAALNSSEPLPAPPNLDWAKVFLLCRLHNVESTIYYSVKKLKLPDEISKQFYQAFKKHTIREAVQSAESELIMTEFEKEGIDNLFLKGFVMKSLYPSKEMRSMGDIDILFKEEQYPKMNSVMLSLGYTGSGFYINEYSFEKAPSTAIEMHKSLLNDGKEYFADPWERCRKKSGTSHCYEMTKEDFYIYMLLHIFKHFSKTGIGVRAVMDVFVYLRELGRTLDREYIESVFEGCGIKGFEFNVVKLSECWFGGRADCEGVCELSDFILTNGTFGKFKNTVATDFEEMAEDGCNSAKLKYIFKKIFPPFSRLSKSYPVLKKYHLLLPFFWVVRCLKLMLFYRKLVFAQLRIIMKVKKTDVERLKNLRNDSGDIGGVER